VVGAAIQHVARRMSVNCAFGAIVNVVFAASAAAGVNVMRRLPSDERNRSRDVAAVADDPDTGGG